MTKLREPSDLLLPNKPAVPGKILENSWFIPILTPVTYSNRVNAPRIVTMAASILVMISKLGVELRFKR